MMNNMKLEYMFWGPLVTKTIVDNHVIKANFNDKGRPWMNENHGGQRAFRVNV